MTEPSDQDNNGGPDLAGYLHSESPRRPEQQGVLQVPSAPPTAGVAHEPDMRDMEKSLVERIADVDDDRRRTAVHLRKAFEAHRDEIRAQRRRDHTAILVVMGIGIILLAAVLLLFAQMFDLRSSLNARLAALQAPEATEQPDDAGTPPHASAGAAPAVTPDDLAGLQTRLASLEQAAGQPATPAAADADAVAPEQIGELADAIESIADRLTALEGRIRNQSAAGTEPDAGTAGGTSAAGLGALEARVGALLDERLASVEARIDEVRASLRKPAGDDIDAQDPGDQNTAEQAAGDAARASMVLSEPMIVLQLAGLSNRDAVARFIDDHPLPAEVYLKSDSLRGQAWFGVIHSLHQDMDSAEAARAALPPELADLDIWLRPLAAGTRLEVLNGGP
jgi:DamX protein